MNTKQIEAARVAITRNMKRHGKMWIRIFPHKSYTKKPLETRMGKGKGPLEWWVAVMRPANVLFEVDGVPEVGRAGVHAPGGHQAADSHPVHLTASIDRDWLSMKFSEIKDLTLAELRGEEPGPASGVVQSAPAAGQRPAGKARPFADAAAGHCAGGNADLATAEEGGLG